MRRNSINYIAYTTQIDIRVSTAYTTTLQSYHNQNCAEITYPGLKLKEIVNSKIHDLATKPPKPYTIPQLQ